jgi:hypothetical protein
VAGDGVAGRSHVDLDRLWDAREEDPGRRRPDSEQSQERLPADAQRWRRPAGDPDRVRAGDGPGRQVLA